MKRMILCASALVHAAAFAATSTVWLGGDGNWSDPTKWSKGVPADTNLEAFVSSGDAGCTITVDQDATFAALSVRGTSQDRRVRLVGAHKLTFSGLDVHSTGALVIDGPECQTTTAINYGFVEVHGGSLKQTGAAFYSTDTNSAFVVSGGAFSAAKRFKMSEHATASFAMTAGSFTCPSFEVIWEASSFPCRNIYNPSGTSTCYRCVNKVDLRGGFFNVSGGTTLHLAPGAHEFGSTTNAVETLQFHGTGVDNVGDAPRYYGAAPVILRKKIDPGVWGSQVAFPHGVAFGSLGNWAYSRRTIYHLRDFLSIDTSDFLDPATSHTIFWNDFSGFSAHLDWSVTGGGAFSVCLVDNMMPLDGRGKIGSLTVGDGTTLEMFDVESHKTSALRCNFLHVADFSLGANAKLYLTPNYSYIQPSELATFGAGAKIYARACPDNNYAVKNNTTGSSVFVVGAGPLGDASDISVEPYEAFGAFPEPWHLTNVVNCVLLTDGTKPTPDATKTQWCGGADNLFSTAGNWANGTTPNLTGGAAVTLNTLDGEIVNDVDNCRLVRFSSTKANGPVRFSGKPIELTGNGYNRGSASAFDYYNGYYPLVFNCDVKGTGTDWFSVSAGNDVPTCYVAFMKRLDSTKPKHFQVCGHVIVGGEAQVNDLVIDRKAGNALASMLEVVRGGDMVVSNQATALAYAPGGIRVNQGGRLAFASGTLSFAANMTTCVHGELSIAALSATSPLSFIGKGDIYLGTTKSSDVPATLSLADRIRLYPAAWNTVTEDGAGPFTLKILTWATLGATNDWTYGVAEGVVTDTSPADRALVIADHETLWIDTQDPKGNGGHAITFADPIVATNAFLVKKGLGALMLASPSNDLSTTAVTVEDGDLAWTAPQVFGALKLQNGARLVVREKDGVFAPIEVRGDVSLAGATVEIDADSVDLAKIWQTVLRLPAGASFGVLPKVGANTQIAVVTNADGVRELRVKRSYGPLTLDADAEIVLEATAPKTTRFAASELQSLLARRFGRAPAIVTARTPGRKAIFLGDSAAARAEAIDASALARDGFRILTTRDALYIVGRDDPSVDAFARVKTDGVANLYYERATLFGVYGFLERIAGMRFYFPGELGTIVPTGETLVVPETDLEDAPDYTVRKVSYFWDGTVPEMDDPSLDGIDMRTLNCYRHRFQTTEITCSHGQNSFYIPERFGTNNMAAFHQEDRLDYFQLRKDGTRCLADDSPSGCVHCRQLCQSSDVWEEFYKDCASYLRGESADVRRMPHWRATSRARGEYAWGSNIQNVDGHVYIDVMPQDGMKSCYCANCQAAYAAASNASSPASELVWGRTAELANRLKADGFDVTLVQMGYGDYKGVPAIDLPDNLLVMLATRGQWSVVTPDVLAAENEKVDAWVNKLGHKVWLWNYPCKVESSSNVFPDIPPMAPHCWGTYYRLMKNWIIGAYAETNCDKWIYNYLNYYIYGRVMWDNDVDTDALIAEHHRLMFGEAAAAAMTEFYDILEDKWVRETMGTPIETAVGPSILPPSDHELWFKVYSPATMARLDELLDSAAATVAPDSIEYRRIAFVRTNFYTPLATRAAAYVEKHDVNKVLAREAASHKENMIVKEGWNSLAYKYFYTNCVLVGENPIRIVVSNTNQTECNVHYTFQKNAPKMKPNTRYRFSYFVKCENLQRTLTNGGGATATVYTGSTGYFYVPATIYPNGTTDWIYNESVFTTGDNVDGETSSAYITLRVRYAVGTAYYDDIRLVELSDGTVFSVE